MNKLFVIGILGLLLVGSVSGYSCIYQEDNYAVKEFKNNLNIIGIRHDIETIGLTEEAIIIKLKYFGPCR